MSSSITATQTTRPVTIADAAQALRTHSGTVLVRGGATKLDWAGRVEHPDLVLDTTEMRGVLTHNPADLTASVRGGTTLAELQEHLAAQDQWLALDPPSARFGATVGGLLATGESGPSRLRYGGIRDLVIGVTLVLADGTVARSGGHVIKNVAGYDLAKLVHGSLGALAVIAEVVVRLHPRPHSCHVLAADADAETATAVTAAVMASPLEPTALEWSSSGGGRLHVRQDGTSAAVASARDRMAALLDGLGLDATELTAEEVERAALAHDGAALGTDGQSVLRVSGLPGDLGALVGAARAATAEHGLDLVVTSSAALGLHTLALGGADPAAHARVIEQVRTRALAQGASVLLARRAPEVDARLDVLGPPPSTAALLGRIKAALDSDGRLAPGRFQPWF